MAYYGDSEAIVYTSNWTPTAPRTVLTAIQCVAAGTVYVDFLGTRPGVPGATNQGIVMVTGQFIEAAIIKVRSASTSGTFRAWY